MDGVYDVLESIHVFIPIIAVVFLVVMVFLFGLSRTNEVEPPVGYIDKLHKEKRTYKEGLPKPKTSPPKLKSTPRHELKETKSASPPPLKEAKVHSSPEKDSTVRQRKKEKKTEEQYEAADEGDWVTVSPKKKAKSPTFDASPRVTSKSSMKEKVSSASENIAIESSNDDNNEKHAQIIDEHVLLQQSPEFIMPESDDVPHPDNAEITQGDEAEIAVEEATANNGEEAINEPIDESEPQAVEQTSSSNDSPKKGKKKKSPSKESPTDDDDGWTMQVSSKNRKQRARRAD